MGPELTFSTRNQTQTLIVIITPNFKNDAQDDAVILKIAQTLLDRIEEETNTYCERRSAMAVSTSEMRSHANKAARSNSKPVFCRARTPAGMPGKPPMTLSSGSRSDMSVRSQSTGTSSSNGSNNGLGG